MRTHNKHRCRCIFLWSVAIALSGAAGIGVRAQQTQQVPQTQVQRQDNGANDDRANFDQFLAQHKDIAKDLQNKPGLVSDPDYLRHHKELQTFFDRNPRAQGELRQDPSFFTRADNRFGANVTPKQRADRDAFLAKHKDIAGDLDANPGLVNDNDYLNRHKDFKAFLDKDPGMRDDFRNRSATDRDRSEIAENARGNPNPDLTRQQLATMDQFLDSHPDIDKQLRNSPSLIDDPNYVRANPQLQSFLAQHPEMQAEFRENPNYFMRRENQLDARGAGLTGNRDANLTPKQRADRDAFLSKHKDIDRDLQANPALVNDNDYLNRHKDFKAFLDKDPEVREQYRYRSGMETGRPETANSAPDRDLTPKQRADRDAFLAKHKDIDKDLQANPALVNDNDYLKRHKDLQAFLDKDPQVQERVRANPSSIVPAKNETQTNTGDRGKDGSAKSSNAKDSGAKNKEKTQKPQKPDDKPKTPIEQREETQPPVH